MKRFLPTLAAIAALAFAAAPAIAPAATERGDSCVADDTETNWTVVSLPGAGAPVPMIVPVNGVITAWKVDVAAGQPTLEHRLQVLRPSGAEFLAVAESAAEMVSAGSNVFPTRIPVVTGDRFGLRGTTETFFCDKIDELTIGVYDGAVPLGATRLFELHEGEGSPLRVVVEPDTDGDGYGDETQDGCPQSPRYQSACPAPARLQVSRRVFRKAIVVKVRTDAEARIQIYGQVRWKVRPRGKTATGKPKPNVRVTQGLAAKRARTVLPGTDAAFRVPLPKSVKRRLSRLTHRQALRPTLTVEATDSLGQVTVRKLKPKLRGLR